MSSLDPTLVALALIPRIGGKTLSALLDAFGTPKAILAATQAELHAISGIGQQTARQIKCINPHTIAHHIQTWQAQGIEIITWDNPAYPKMLSNFVDRPPALFKYGNWNTQETQTIAIVGTRQPSTPATQFAQLLAHELIAAGWTVISGLARGIDTDAHLGALATQGTTVAVLGSGVKHIYPPENLNLARRIVTNGSLLSEVAPQAEPSSGQLVARNRIISGLSQSVVVVETGTPGGALHTVRFAHEQGRPVYVVNFPVRGNQQLINEGMPAIAPTRDGILQFLQTINQPT